MPERINVNCPGCGGCTPARSFRDNNYVPDNIPSDGHVDATHRSCTPCGCGAPFVYIAPPGWSPPTFNYYPNFRREDHPDFLPISVHPTIPGALGSFCNVSVIGIDSVGVPRNARCTRPPDHEGDHASHADRRTMIARWSRNYMPRRYTQCSSCGYRIGDQTTACTNRGCIDRQTCLGCCGHGRLPQSGQTGRGFIGDPTARYPRYIGVEIECGKSNPAKTAGYSHVIAAREKWGFRIGGDGSIRDFNIASAEISTVPARGDKFDEQAKDLGDALIADDMKANSSCGLHVHIDVRDYTYEHLMGFIYLYAKVENALYRLVAPSRRTNHFSLQWGKKLQEAKILDGRSTTEERSKRLDILMYGSESQARDYKTGRSRHECRYHGVNFNAISVHGTLEFRMHHGTVNPTKIRMWSAVCSALVEYAFKHTEEEIRALRAPPTEVLDRVIGDPEVIAWTKARRLLFANMERKRRGLPPLAKAEKAISIASHRSRIPVVDPGEVELSEDTGVRSVVGERLHAHR